MVDKPLILLGSTMWWPLSARLASALIHHGCRVSAVCPTGHPLRFIAGIEHLYPYRRLDSLASLKSAITASRPDLVVPCDDGVVWQLHSLHAQYPELRQLIEYSLGPAEMYPTIRSRAAVLRAGSDLGIRIPVTEIVSSEGDLEKWDFRSAAVLKADGTWGGDGVEIAHSRSEAMAAYRTLSRPRGASAAWKRFLVNHDPLALWWWRNCDKPSLTIQQFITGRPANTMFVSWKGEVRSMLTVEVVSAQDATGAANVVRIIQNAEITRAACLLARRFTLNGFHGLDFMLEKGTGKAYLIELNPRCTQLGHLRIYGQGDLAGVFAAALKGTAPAPADDFIGSQTIAFFPQAFFWNPHSPYLRQGHHDVPWEEPTLLHELLQEQWPNRQWLARAYHALRPPNKKTEAQFNNAPHNVRDQSPAEEAAFANRH